MSSFWGGGENLEENLIEESLNEAFSVNCLSGLEIEMDAQTGSAKLIQTDEKTNLVSFKDKLEPLTVDKLVELVKNRRFAYADVYKLDSTKHLIRIYAHHLICDGKGGQIVINDFVKLLNSKLKKEEIKLQKVVNPGFDYIPYIKGGDKLSFILKMVVFFFNKFIAPKRPPYTYDELIDLQQIALKQEGFAYEEFTFTKEQTDKIVKLAKDNGMTVSSYMIYKLCSVFERDTTEVSVSIDGRKYFDVPEASTLLPAEENPRNFASGGKILFNRNKDKDSDAQKKSILQQIQALTQPKNATLIFKLFKNLNTAVIDLGLKYSAQIPMTTDEAKAHDALQKALGFSIVENGFDFAGFGRIKTSEEPENYSIDDYKIIVNTTAVYPLKFGISTYKDCLTIIMTYKTSLISKETASNIMNKLVQTI
ncbi:MAG: hypothetical protein MJ162_03935 [Treponema sp.]|nr:hypothetical protein [Treponema sp.]